MDHEARTATAHTDEDRQAEIVRENAETVRAMRLFEFELASAGRVRHQHADFTFREACRVELSSRVVGSSAIVEDSCRRVSGIGPSAPEWPSCRGHDDLPPDTPGGGATIVPV